MSFCKKSIKKLMDTFLKLEKMILNDMNLRINREYHPAGYNYQLPDSNYDEKQKSITYFIGHNYSRNNYLDFTDWFLNRREATPLFFSLR